MSDLLALARALLTNLLAFCLSPLASELNQPKPETFLPTTYEKSLRPPNHHRLLHRLRFILFR
jgi:hypothetical protein